MNNPILITILVLFFPILINGQAIYNGHVKDVATRQGLSDVKVHLLQSSEETTSNYFGNFVIKNTEKDTVINPLNTYRFYNNAMIWDEDFDISVEIFSTDGRLVSQEPNLGNKGSYLLPTLPFGIYLLHIKTIDEIQVFKAFSDGEMMTVSDKEAFRHHSSVVEKEDTLLFSKEGYYPRMVELTGRDTSFNINLLKEEIKELHYFNELIAPVAFELISGVRSRSIEGKAETVKIIYNTEDELMYYINTKLYSFHFNFAETQLGFNQGNTVFNQTQYRENDGRYMYPAVINYYESIDKYLLYLIPSNEMTCENVKILYDKIVETSFMKDKLYLFANRTELNFCGVPVVTTDELHKGQNYQALNVSENYGYLNKVDLDDLEDTYLGRRDIVLLNGVPNDVSVVAGIITTEFQTPLSHINVLSHNRNTPNMALRDGWENERLDTLLNELVYLKVEAFDFEIRKATLEEANEFWAKSEPQEVIDLPKNTSVEGLIDLEEADHTYLDIIGGKSANFSEMLNVSLDGKTIPTPESSFAIPFYYYDQHLKGAGLDVFIDEMLQDENFINSPAIRQERLEELQDKIKDHPLDPVLIDLVENEINNFEDFPSFRFRSSTNAEDLEDFSGAGLYSSHSAKKDNQDKKIDRAIKKVWASLWNWRAFEERSYYKIVHTSCAMGILVHRSFPDEDANGVLVTRNIYSTNPSFIINVQYKDYSIVFPEPSILNDQIMLITWSTIPGQDFMAEYLTFSNVPELNGETVMTNDELLELGAYCLELKKHFYYNLPHTCECTEKNFALDIEFKVDSYVDERKIYIKQARFYK